MNSNGALAAVVLNVNGTDHPLHIEPRVSLLDALREYIGLTGTKKGCNQGACGACTVLVDGERINACLALAMQYQGRKITTIEGLGQQHHLHPLQQAFITHDGFQCGYCTPGQICSAVGMIAEFQNGMPSAVTADMTDMHPRVACVLARWFAIATSQQIRWCASVIPRCRRRFSWEHRRSFATWRQPAAI